jgi:ketosteroid isomerase-like protein
MGEFRGRRTGEALEERIGRLEDIEAIRALKARYAQLCDGGYDADALAGLFVEGASWESNAFGAYHGRDEIRRFFAGISEDIVWAVHFMVCPVVEIGADAMTATGSWYLLELATMTRPGGRDAVVMTGRYDDAFVREGDEWRFQQIRVHFHQVSNWDRGWVDQPFRGSAGTP